MSHTYTHVYTHTNVQMILRTVQFFMGDTLRGVQIFKICGIYINLVSEYGI